METPLSNSREVANSLHNWATDELKVLMHDDMPTADDLERICKFQFQDVWQFVLARVRSTQTVKKIKGNIQLHGKDAHKGVGSDNQEIGKLRERRRQLQSELDQANSEVKGLQEQIGYLKTDVSSADYEYNAAISKIDNTRRKSSLLESFSLKSHEEVEQYLEFKRRIDHQLAAVSRHSVAPRAELAAIEMDCKKKVYIACESICSHIHHTLEFSEDKEALDSSNASVWRQVDAVLGSFTIPQVRDALITNCQESTLQLAEKTRNINIKRDAEQLRFKYVNGHLENTSADKTELQTVPQLLEGLQDVHISSFFEAEKSKNATWKSSQKVDDISEAIDQELQRRFSKKPEELELNKKLIHTELELVTERVKLPALQQDADNLRENINKTRREEEELQRQYQKIQDFENLTVRKQDQIRVLVRQNLESANHLDLHRKENHSYMEKILTSHEGKVNCLTAELGDHVTKEVNVFNGLFLQDLLRTSLDGIQKVSIVDMAIHRFSPMIDTAAHRYLRSAVSQIGCRPYKAPDTMVTSCLDVLNKSHDAAATVLLLEKTYDSMNLKLYTKDAMSDLFQQVSDHDEKHVSKSLPVLQKNMLHAAKAVTNSVGVKSAVDIWWNEPAFLTVPWIKVGDRNLKEWLDAWNVALTRFRQNEAKQKH